MCHRTLKGAVFVKFLDINNDKKPDYTIVLQVCKRSGSWFYQPAKKREPTEEEIEWLNLFGRR